MGFLHRVFGKGNNVEQESRTSGLPLDAAAVTPPSTSAQEPLRIPTVPEHVPPQVGSMVRPHEDTAVMYNPYAGLQHINPRGAHIFRVNREPEFVFQEEAAVRRRGFATNIGFYTGTGYFGGALAGGSVGLAQTLLQPTTQPLPQSRRLLINRILNSSGHTGRMAVCCWIVGGGLVGLAPTLLQLTTQPLPQLRTLLINSILSSSWHTSRMAGNTLGCLGLLFAISESWSGWILDERVPNAPFWLPTILAGAFAGGIFRSPRGPKAAAITASVGAIAGAGLCSLRQILPGL